MNDNSGRTSCLAITDKRLQRPGGFVGIFFQLFDWNRRSGKKKLFSKKLLPPAHAKQASKKFGGDEKRPKLRLIADEKSGGFPNVKKHETLFDCEQKRGVHAPGLVARLMGLESMPAVQQDKLKKASSSEIGRDKSEEFLGDHNGFLKEDQNLEKARTKHELRPQKLQKTGPYERLPVTRFGAEAMQFKNVLSKSRKYHPIVPKVSSPVKTPKSLSSRNTSRLIGAATKVFEPGLLVRNRAKCALTYSKTMSTQGSDDYVSETNLSKGNSSCKNCNNLLDIVDARPKIEERQSVFGFSALNHVNSSSEGSESSSKRSPISSIEQEKERVIKKSCQNFTSFVTQAKNNMGPRAEPISDRMSIDRGCKKQWHLTNQQCKLQKDSLASPYSKPNSQRQKVGSIGRDRVPPKSKHGNLQTNRDASAANSINETKDFVSSNQSISGRTRYRIHNKVDSVKFDSESKFGNRQDDSLSPVRKWRSMNVARQGEGSGFVSCISENQKSTSYNALTGKEIRCRLAHLRESNRTGNSDSGVVSFTFSSPMKHKMSDQVYSTHNNTRLKNSSFDGDDGKVYIKKEVPLKRDALGVVLEQKWKELSSREGDELPYECTTPKRTSALILQELISALNAEKLYPQDDVALGPGKNDSSELVHIPTRNRNAIFQAKVNIGGTSMKYLHENDNLSPGSVLDASFAVDSSFSDSVDDDSRHKLHSDLMDGSYDTPQPLEPNTDFFDSANLLNNWRKSKEFVTNIHNHISKLLCSIDLTGSPLNGIKLIHAKDVIMNAELLFQNMVLHNLDRTHNFSITHFLINELEALASATRAEFGCFLGFKDAIDGNIIVNSFVFDSVVEYLESRYRRYFKSGFKAWRRMLAVCVNSEMMIREVVEEIRRWGSLGGAIIDEVIEREMSCCLGKWTDFEIEEFEAGSEIDGEIMQILVDEVVMDLWECRLGFMC